MSNRNHHFTIFYFFSQWNAFVIHSFLLLDGTALKKHRPTCVRSKQEKCISYYSEFNGTGSANRGDFRSFRFSVFLIYLFLLEDAIFPHSKHQVIDPFWPFFLFFYFLVETNTCACVGRRSLEQLLHMCCVQSFGSFSFVPRRCVHAWSSMFISL